jgi:hypothetical protein
MLESVCAESKHTSPENIRGSHEIIKININMVNIYSIYNILFNLYMYIIENISYSGEERDYYV